MTKLAKIITNNFGLKILAIVFALVIWLIVVNVEDPDKTKAFSIPVTVENEAYLTDLGKTYEVLDNTDTISFTVTGKRSIIEALSESDFTAKADLENIDDTMSMIPITVSSSRYSSQIEITKRSSFVRVNVENLVSETFDIQVTTTGEPADSCYVDATKTDPKKVTITGPESVIGTIDTVVAYVSVNGATEDIATKSSLILQDANGIEIAQDRLSMNRDEVAVDVSIHKEKDVPLNISVTGEPAEGYRLDSVTGSFDTVRIAGDADVVDAVESIDLVDDGLNIEGKSESQNLEINLINSLPTGISLATKQSDTIEVEIIISGQVSQNYDIPWSNIIVTGLDQTLQIQNDSADTLTVTLTGYEDDLLKFTADTLAGTIDLSDYKAAGNYSVPINITGADETISAQANITIIKNDTSALGQ